MNLDETQLRAVDMAVSSRFCVINGGAGVGKTTIIKKICEEIPGDPLLCAFAGKAAARMRDATGLGASTIHRMLGWRGESFTLGDLKNEVVIMDEASMVSSDIMAEVVKRSPKKLVLVGDQAQLPPVGSGQPFQDIINLFPNRVFTLTKCYRNSEAIFKAAMAIRNGNLPLGYDKTENEMWEAKHTGDAEKTHKFITEMIAKEHANGTYDPAKDIILCPRNGAGDKVTGAPPATVESLNADIMAIVNPRDKDHRGAYKVGDRVINTKNQSDLDIWNGTTGTVHAVYSDGGMIVELDDKIVDSAKSMEKGETQFTKMVSVTKEQAKHFQLAYALSVHKSQGSQYRRVFFVCLGRDQMVLIDRSMIYTAVTRAKVECHVVGELRAMNDAINTVRNKHTVIQEISRGTK